MEWHTLVRQCQNMYEYIPGRRWEQISQWKYKQNDEMFFEICIRKCCLQNISHFVQGPLLLTWINFSPSMEKELYLL